MLFIHYTLGFWIYIFCEITFELSSPLYHKVEHLFFCSFPWSQYCYYMWNIKYSEHSWMNNKWMNESINEWMKGGWTNGNLRLSRGKMKPSGKDYKITRLGNWPYCKNEKQNTSTQMCSGLAKSLSRLYGVYKNRAKMNPIFFSPSLQTFPFFIWKNVSIVHVHPQMMSKARIKASNKNQGPPYMSNRNIRRVSQSTALEWDHWTRVSCLKSFTSLTDCCLAFTVQLKETEVALKAYSS